MTGWLFDFSTRRHDYELEAAVDVQAELADDLEGDELRVARHLMTRWATESPGLTEKLRQVEGMSRSEKRKEADGAFDALGLETPSDRRAREAVERACDGARRLAASRPVMTCAICGAAPLTATGLPDPNLAVVRRWHCPAHEHLAEDGDFDPLPSGIALDMRQLPDPDEVEAEARRDERLQQAQAERDEQRRLRGLERAEVERRREEQSERELFGGRPG